MEGAVTNMLSRENEQFVCEAANRQTVGQYLQKLPGPGRKSNSISRRSTLEPAEVEKVLKAEF